MTYEQSRDIIAAGYGCKIEGRPNSIIIMQSNSRTLPLVRPQSLEPQLHHDMRFIPA